MSEIEDKLNFEICARAHGLADDFGKEDESGDYLSIKTQRLYWLWEFALSQGKESCTNNQGKERLWGWFSLSYASFLILPGAGMHQMPDEWQDRMAGLLEEWSEAAKNQPDLEFIVQARKNGKLAPVPLWIRNYRHPHFGAWGHFFGKSSGKGG